MKAWVHRYWYLFSKSIAPPTGPPANDGFTCRRATAADVPSFAAFRPYREPDELAAWMREPETWLFVAFDGDRAIAYDCATRRLPASPPFRDITLAGDEIWVRDIYTVPAYRRRRVMRTLRGCRNAGLRAAGFARTMSAVAEDNIASLISTYDGCVCSVAGIDYQRVLVARRSVLDVDARKRLERLLEAEGHLPAVATISPVGA